MYKVSLGIVLGLVITMVWSHPIKDQSENDGLYGDHFEGDMILNREQMLILTAPSMPSPRNGLILEKYRWPNKTLIYQLSPDHTNEQNNYIKTALKTIESISRVKFVERTNEEHYVKLFPGGGCFSSVGYQSGVQPLSLANSEPGKSCFRIGAIMHEFLHALGFYHMQSAHDRDEYVKIHWENMMTGTENNFYKYSSTQVSHFNTTYDYDSIMHYTATAFSKNGLPTIIPIDESYLNKIGQLIRLSEKDIYKLNQMYECHDTNGL